MSAEVLNAQAQLEAAVDAFLDALEAGAAEGAELDPLATIVERLQARGEELNLDEAPPMMRMLLGGMLP